MIFVVAPIGAIDVVYFHLFKYKLYKNPDSRKEQVTHISRSMLLGIGVLALVCYQPSGAWFWAIGAVFAVDLLNNVIDVSMEYRSRARIGGLSSHEYIVHVIGATGMGGATVSYFALGWALKDAPTALVAVDLGTLVTYNGYVVAAGAFALGLVELVLTLKHRASTEPSMTAA